MSEGSARARSPHQDGSIDTEGMSYRGRRGLLGTENGENCWMMQANHDSIDIRFDGQWQERK